MSEPSLPEKVLAVHGALARARIGHAFGGALALAYYAEPRATVDVDVNVFVSPAEQRTVAAALTPLGVAADADPDATERDGQCRWSWGRTPIDLFFAYDELHDAMREAARTVDFGDTTITILAPEHLAVCKAVFDRPKDWLDIEQMLVCVDELDTVEIDRWLVRIVGAEDARRLRVGELVATAR
jgi:hypothetical protein